VAESNSTEDSVPMPRSAWMLLTCGLWLVVLGLYFMLIRPALLPEDILFFGEPLARIQAEMPELEHWLKLVFVVLGGFATGTGGVSTRLVVVAFPHRPRGAAGVIAVVGLSTVALMSAVNFELHSDFQWVLLVPTVLWSAGLSAYVLEGRRLKPRQRLR
jgi:hypothetical protein